MIDCITSCIELADTTMPKANICSNLLLNLIKEKNIMEIDEVLDILTMNKAIQRAMLNHPYEIHYTPKSGYFTDVDDASRPSGKRKIRKATKEALMITLADWYTNHCSVNITFKELFEKWLNWKSAPGNQDNIKRLLASWKSYYETEPLSQNLINKQVAKISSLDLREWAESLLKKHYPVDKKKFSRMFTIVNQCLEYAADEDIAIIPENIWTKARKKINRSLIVSKPVASDETQVFTDQERQSIRAMVYNDLERYPNHPTSAGLQILFLFETGLRIGECCGLKWSDIKGNRLYIRRQATNQGVKEWTKSVSGYRDIPLTKEALRILEDVARFNQEHHLTSEWIFQSDNPAYDYRLGYNAADRKLRKLCNRLGTSIKSPHKCRKTCISTLLDNPAVNNRTVQRFAGHHDISTTYSYYNFDRKSKEEQAEAIDAALRLS